VSFRQACVTPAIHCQGDLVERLIMTRRRPQIPGPLVQLQVFTDRRREEKVLAARRAF